MSTVTGFNSIRINTPYPINRVHHMEITHSVNEHARLYLEGVLEGVNPVDFSMDTSSSDMVQISIGDSVDDILFTGIPISIETDIKYDVCHITLECRSCTYDMDITEQSRSFQYKKMPYYSLLEFIARKYPGGDYRNTAAKDKSIKRLILQYRETDWEFFKRVASHEQTVLTADITDMRPRFWFGLPEPNKEIALERIHHEVIQQTESVRDINRYHYEAELSEYLKIGDIVTVKGLPLTVTRSSIKTVQGVLLYRYHLENKSYIKTKLYRNRRIQGLSLGGTILDVARNHVKIHLDIDPGQKIEEGYWFPYAGESNQVWYNMPHVGEFINIYFPASDESQVITMSTRRGDSVRETPSLSKPTEKYFETKWNKTMALHEGDILFNTPLMSITLDEESISVVSNDKINIETTTDINIGKSVFQTKDGEVTEETKNIKMETEDLTTFCVENGNNAIELDTDSAIYVLTTSKMKGSVKANLPNLTSKGQQEKEQDGQNDSRQAEGNNGIQWGRIGEGILKAAGAVAAGGIAVKSIANAATSKKSEQTAIAGIVVTASAIYHAANTLNFAANTFMEGLQDISLGLAGKTKEEQPSVNKLMDEKYGGDEEAYYKAFMQNFILTKMSNQVMKDAASTAASIASGSNRINAIKRESEVSRSKVMKIELKDGTKLWIDANGIIPIRVLEALLDAREGQYSSKWENELKELIGSSGPIMYGQKNSKYLSLTGSIINPYIGKTINDNRAELYKAQDQYLALLDKITSGEAYDIQDIQDAYYWAKQYFGRSPYGIQETMDTTMEEFTQMADVVVVSAVLGEIVNAGVSKFNSKGAGKVTNQIEGNSYDINKLQKTQPYTYPENVASIKEEIAQNGPNAVPPIEIRVHNGQVLVVDGHHRLEAFRQLGYDRVPIKYLHSSQLGRMLPDGTYYRSIEELLDAVEISN